MLQLLVRVPEDTTFDNLPEEIAERINVINGATTNNLLWNTRVWFNRKLINFICNEDVTLTMVKDFISEFGLDWVILGANNGYKEVEGEKVINTLRGYNPDVVIRFIARKRVYDAEGNFVEEVEPTEIEFGKFSGFPILQPREI